MPLINVHIFVCVALEMWHTLFRKKTSIARKMKTVIRCNQKCDSRDFVFLEGQESMDTESEGRDLYYQSQINWKYTSYVL